MASIWKSSEGIFRIRYFQNGKQITRSLRTRDKKIAEQQRQEFEVKLRKGELQTTTPASIEPYYEDYKKHFHDRARSTNAREFYEARKFIEFSKKRMVGSITRDDVERYLERYKTMAPKTYNGVITALRGFFVLALQRKYIFVHPCDGIRRRKVPQSLPHFFTDEEYMKIETEAATMLDSCVFPMIVTARYTGMRLGELLALEWHDFDWEKKLVRVVNKLFHTVKNYQCRTVPISDELRDKLLPYIKASGLCFPTPNGGKYEHEGPRRDLRTIFRKIGIDPKERKGWHEFRHTFASRLAQQGISLYKIMKWLGHSSMQVTQIYAHFAPAYDSDIECLTIKSNTTFQSITAI